MNTEGLCVHQPISHVAHITLHLFFGVSFKADQLLHYGSNFALNITFDQNLYAAHGCEGFIPN